MNQIWKLIATWHRRLTSPRETGQRPGDVLLPEPSNWFPDTLSRSPLQAGPTHPLDQLTWNMGPASARRKRPNGGQMRLAAGPIPGSAIVPRLINVAGFDKAV